MCTWKKVETGLSTPRCHYTIHNSKFKTNWSKIKRCETCHIKHSMFFAKSFNHKKKTLEEPSPKKSHFKVYVHFWQCFVFLVWAPKLLFMAEILQERQKFVHLWSAKVPDLVFNLIGIYYLWWCRGGIYELSHLSLVSTK